MDSDALEHFGPLDELIQVIYQGIHRFVLVSKVDFESWTLHLGLTEQGRWWRGRWLSQDILALAGSKSSAKYLEAFAEKLAETFIKGELHVNNWSSEKGAQINIALGPTGKMPIEIPLIELSSEDAAAYAVGELFSIANQAQSRNCRLNPLPFQVETVSLITSKREPPPSRTNCAKPREPSPESSVSKATKDQISSLRDQLAQARAQVSQQSGEQTSASAKGAAMAHPRKKARKVQAIEFASDDE